MKNPLPVLLFALLACPLAPAQSNTGMTPPAANVGGAGPSAGGDRSGNYHLSFTQTEWTGEQAGSVVSDSALSGDISEQFGSQVHPFSAVYSARFDWADGGQLGENGMLQGLDLTQKWISPRSSLTVSDSINYWDTFTPDQGASSGMLSGPTPGVFSYSTQMLDNSAAASWYRSATQRITLNSSALETTSRFLDGYGYDIDQFDADGGLSWRMNQKSSLGFQSSYRAFTYVGQNLSYRTIYAGGTYSTMIRRTSVSFGAGPLWVVSSSPGNSTTSNSYQTFVDISRTTADRNQYAVEWSHYVGNGSGYMLGAESDMASADFSHAFGPRSSFNVEAQYSNSNALDGNQNIISRGLRGNFSRKLSRHFSAYVSYGATSQSLSGAFANPNLVNSILQYATAGVSYTNSLANLFH